MDELADQYLLKRARSDADEPPAPPHRGSAACGPVKGVVGASQQPGFPVVTKKNTMLRLAIPVRHKLAICVRRLARSEALREVSRRFGLGISTCHKLVLEDCAAIRSVLMPKFLQWSDDNRTAEIKRKFEASFGNPGVGGVIYTTHIPIIGPKVSVAAYFNKRWRGIKWYNSCEKIRNI